MRTFKPKATPSHAPLKELERALPANVDNQAVLQFIATGDVVAKNVAFGVIAQHGSVVTLDITVGKNVYGVGKWEKLCMLGDVRRLQLLSN